MAYVANDFNVKFLKGTAAEYTAAAKVATTFYYTTDDSQVYLGTIKLSNAAAVQALADLIGEIPADVDADTIVEYIQSVATEVGNLRDELADVAFSGEAADVAITDTENHFVATDVEGALKELAEAITGTGTAGAVTVEKTSPEGVAARYTFKQGGIAIANGVIDIPTDMVVESGTVVTDPEGQEKGTYLKLVLANADEDEVFINVSNLIEYVTAGADTATVHVEVSTDHKVTANVIAGSIGATQLDTATKSSLAAADSALQAGDITTGTANGTIAVKGTDVAVAGLGTAAYEDTTAFDAAGAAADVLGKDGDAATANTVYGAKAAANNAAVAAKAAQDDVDALEGVVGTPTVGETVGTGLTKRIEDLENALGEGGDVAEQIAAAIDLLDGSADQDAAADNGWLQLEVTSADGVVTGISGSITPNKYDTYGTGAAEAAKVLGQSGDAATTATVYGVIAKAQAIEDGLGTAAAKSVEDFDAAGAADAVLGTAADGATAKTVYGAIAKAQAIEDGLGTAAAKNVEDFDAAGAAADVLGKASDTATTKTVYGAIAKAQAIEDGLGTAAAANVEDFDAAGAAETAETNAKHYTESLLTWGSIA